MNKTYIKIAPCGIDSIPKEEISRFSTKHNGSYKFLNDQQTTNSKTFLSNDFLSVMGLIKETEQVFETGLSLLNLLSTLEARYGITTETFKQEYQARSREINSITSQDIELWSRASFLYND